MSTLKFDLSTYDLYVENGATEIETDISEETRQRLIAKFKMFKGEYFLNANYGVPYYEDFLIKNPSVPKMRTILARVLRTDEQVSQVQDLRLDFDRSLRKLTASFSVLLTDGSVLDFGQLDLGVF